MPLDFMMVFILLFSRPVRSDESHLRSFSSSNFTEQLPCSCGAVPVVEENLMLTSRPAS